MVGRPRRRTEWCTESSCTSVARWITSTTAASVTARASPPPAARCDSSSRVGRNSFPFIVRRCSFTSLMMGKSPAMIRRSSSTTRSSSPDTGSWISRSVTPATCWLTSPRLRQRLRAPLHVHEANIDRENPPVQVARLDLLPLLLERPHPGGAPVVFDLRCVDHHRPEIHKSAVGRCFVAQLHLGVFGLDLPLALGGRGHRREHRERRLGARIAPIVLGDALVHRP